MKLTEHMNSKLCELPDSEFSAGGTIDRMAKEAGYASGKSFANDLNLWGASVGEVVAMLKNDGASYEG
jgi:hypothetical protein